LKIEEIIRTLPFFRILPLPDGKPNLEYFDGSTNGRWLDSIENLANSRKEEFVFYGGSKEDLADLAERFETKVLVDRFVEGEDLSATKVRDHIIKKETEELEKYVDKKAIKLILDKYKNI
jgi:hypothetical protein